MPKDTDAPSMAALSLKETQDRDSDDLFNERASTATGQMKGQAPQSAPSSVSKQPRSRVASKQELVNEREARLQSELEQIRAVNRTIEGVTASLIRAKENMATVDKTVNSASNLLTTWTRILSQTEHNQRLILNPGWNGATQDMEDMENEEVRAQQEAERKAMEEERRRQEEAARRAEEEEKRRAAAASASSNRAGSSISRRGSVRSVRGTRASQMRANAAAAQAGRGRGTSTGAGTTTGIARGSGIGRGSSIGSRGRGRGIG